VGLDERMAALQLRRAGLEVGATARLPYGAAPEGTVLAQDPPAHAQGIAQPSINLLVAAPFNVAPDGFVMPDLTGRTMASAQAELAKVGMKSVSSRFVDVPVGPTEKAETLPKLPVRPGTVVTQQPPAGARVEQHTQVKLTVAK
jgi:eukaryotic-like serine/threonine-protein kinase